MPDSNMPLIFPLPSHQNTRETTNLSPYEDIAFRLWARKAGVRDLDNQNSFYDYRGYWKDPNINPIEKQNYQFGRDHLPDLYKQHGHPLFSSESVYSRGPQDGGQWLEDYLIKPPDRIR